METEKQEETTCSCGGLGDPHNNLDDLCEKCAEKAISEGKIFVCPCCENYTPTDTGSYVEDMEQTVCDDCIDHGDFFVCDNCGNRYSGDTGHTWDHDSVYCEHCIDANPDLIEQEITQQQMRDANLKSTVHQSDEQGDIIKSKLRFGVELEVINDNSSSVDEGLGKLAKEYGIAHDGSIRGNNPVEIVSPILKGKAGEASLKKCLKILRDAEFDTNESCGFHVHIEAKDFVGDSQEIVSRYENLQKIGRDATDRGRTIGKIVIFNQEAFKVYCSDTGSDDSDGSKSRFADILVSWYDDSEAENEVVEIDNYARSGRTLFIKRSGIGSYSGETTYQYKAWVFTKKKEDELDDEFNDALVLYRNKTKEAKANGVVHFEPRPNRQAYFMRQSRNTDFCKILIEQSKNFVQLKNTFLFYTAFNDVFMAMLPEDRRDNDRYCRKMIDSFSPIEISRLRNQQELEKYWYNVKSQNEVYMRKRSHRDNSRYHGVNFHSLFDHGTIEIRWHGGTLDDDTILLWTALHQHIVDTMKNTHQGHTQNLIKLANTLLLKNKIKNFLNFLDLGSDTVLGKYVRQRVEHFTGEKIK